MNDNPFAILTAVAAPAILTNACSVLSLGTANRIARVVDRARVVIAARAGAADGSSDHQAYDRQLSKLRRRGNLLLKALRFFYAALGLFATTALTAIIGSAFVAYELQQPFHITAVIGFGAGILAVTSLVTGCAIMVRETRLAVQSVAEEYDLPSASRILAEQKPAPNQSSDPFGPN